MSLEALLKRVYDLPSIPKVVQDLIENFKSDVADADAISRNIQSDPVIAAKVLRLANSVRYGAGRKVGSLDSAVVMLGTEALKTLVIASGVTSTFKSIPGLDAREFWRNSFMVANICKLLARKSKGADPETAFTCGMLHNIGIALMYFAEPEKMQMIQAEIPSDADRTEAERKHFGFDNNEVGARLAQTWKFPCEIVEGLRFQGRPLHTDPFSPYAAVIMLAQYINAGLECGVEREALMAGMPEELSGPIGLDVIGLFDELSLMLEAEDDIDSLLAA